MVGLLFLTQEYLSEQPLNLNKIYEIYCIFSHSNKGVGLVVEQIQLD